MRFLLTYLLLPLIFWLHGPGLSSHSASATQPVTGGQQVHTQKNLYVENFVNTDDIARLSLLTDDNETEEDEDENSFPSGNRYTIYGNWLPCPAHLLVAAISPRPLAGNGHTTRSLFGGSYHKHILLQVFRI